MEKDNQITFGNFSPNEIEHIRHLAQEIQGQLTPQNETNPITDIFQIDPDPAEVREFIENENNNADKNATEIVSQSNENSQPQVESYHSLDGNETIVTGSTVQEHNNNLLNVPKPQRLIVKAVKRNRIVTKSKSLIDMFKSAKTMESNTSILNIGFAADEEDLDLEDNQSVARLTISSILSRTPSNFKRFSSTQSETLEKVNKTTSVGSSLIKNIQSTVGTTMTTTRSSTETTGLSNDLQFTSQPQPQNRTNNFEAMWQQIMNDSRTSSMNITQINEPTSTPLTLQQRLDIRVFPPALAVWRQLRNLQGRKVILELRTSYHDKLLTTRPLLRLVCIIFSTSFSIEYTKSNRGNSWTQITGQQVRDPNSNGSNKRGECLPHP